MRYCGYLTFLYFYGVVSAAGETHTYERTEGDDDQERRVVNYKRIAIDKRMSGGRIIR